MWREVGNWWETTLLHFVVQEIIRTEGRRAARTFWWKVQGRDYFHLKAEKDEGLCFFVFVLYFLVILYKSCKIVREARGKPLSRDVKKTRFNSHSFFWISRQSPSLDPRQKLFPAITKRRMDMDQSSSDYIQTKKKSIILGFVTCYDVNPLRFCWKLHQRIFSSVGSGMLQRCQFLVTDDQNIRWSLKEQSQKRFWGEKKARDSLTSLVLTYYSALVLGRIIFISSSRFF